MESKKFRKKSGLELQDENISSNRPQRSLRERKGTNYVEAELSFEKADLDTSADPTFNVGLFYGQKTKSYVKKIKMENLYPIIDDDDDEEISEYEKQRLKNIEENKRMMKELGLLDAKKEAKKIFQKIQPKIPTKRIRKTASPLATPVEPKRSLRLQGKTPTGEVFTPTINDTPSNDLGYISRSRKLGELSMAEDESCIDMLDKLRNCLSSSSTPTNETTSVDIERLIKDMRGLNLAALQTKVVNKRIQSLCIHPMESKLLVIAGSVGGSLGLWDVGSDSSLAEYEPHTRPVNCISVSSNDYSKLFSTSHDGTIRRADIQKGTFDLVYQTDEIEKISHITWHCELSEQTLLVGHGSGVVGVVDLRLDLAKSLTRSFICHARSVRTVQLHPTQPQYFLTSSGTGEAKIFDIRQKKKDADDACNLLHKSNKTGNGLTSAFFSPDGNKVLTTCNDDRLRIFDVSDFNKPTEAHRIIHDNHTGRWLSVFKAKWHPVSSDVFFVGSLQYPKRIQIYNGSGEIMRELKSEDMTTICPVLDIHPTQSIVAGGDSVGRVYVFATQELSDKLNLLEQ